MRNFNKSIHEENGVKEHSPVSPTMYPTIEIRWFKIGPIPAAVGSWREDAWDHQENEEERLDYYLQPIEPTDTLGIKLRQGRIEIKMRTSQLGAVQFGRKARGYLESWRKWSLPLAETVDLAQLGHGRTWVAVEKKRWLYRARQPGPQPDLLDEGLCEVELARIIASGRLWWSVALEATGEAEAPRKRLLDIAGPLWAKPNAPHLALDESAAYPNWLWSRVSLIG